VISGSDAVEAAGEVGAVRSAEILDGGGEGDGVDGLPIVEVGGGLDGHLLSGGAADREGEQPGFEAQAAGNNAWRTVICGSA
jgi:hypothetical protein